MSSPSHKADLTRGPDEADISARLNWLRAGVLGANDGIVSIAALLVGVAAATTNISTILTAAIAGVAAGALSMAVGEYVSVSSQRDAEEAQLARERTWHTARPEWELEQLVRLNIETGMSEETARKASVEQTAKDPIGIHARMHLSVDPESLTSPIHAGVASFFAFTVGGIAPLLTILLLPVHLKIPLTFVAVLIALAATGYTSAHVAYSPYLKAMIRNVIGGASAMAITWGIGLLVGGAVTV